MRTVTFVDPELAEWLNAHFVLAWVDTAPGRAGGSATAQPPYALEEIAAYPEGGGGENIRTYYCTPDGVVRHAITGFWRPEAFRLEADRALERYLRAREPSFAKIERAAVRAKLLEEADALEKAHPEERAKPIRESGVLRKAAALRLMGDLYQKTEPLLGKRVGPILDEVIQENAVGKEIV